MNTQTKRHDNNIRVFFYTLLTIIISLLSFAPTVSANDQFNINELPVHTETYLNDNAQITTPHTQALLKINNQHANQNFDSDSDLSSINIYLITLTSKQLGSESISSFAKRLQTQIDWQALTTERHSSAIMIYVPDKSTDNIYTILSKDAQKYIMPEELQPIYKENKQKLVSNNQQQQNKALQEIIKAINTRLTGDSIHDQAQLHSLELVMKIFEVGVLILGIIMLFWLTLIPMAIEKISNIKKHRNK